MFEENIWTEERRTDRRAEKTALGGVASFVLVAKYNQNYEVEDDEVGGACNANGGEEDSV
jgi:hypothetical protein